MMHGAGNKQPQHNDAGDGDNQNCHRIFGRILKHDDSYESTHVVETVPLLLNVVVRLLIDASAVRPFWMPMFSVKT
jgi:hypothetical protein